jgi:hypothetical protein
MPGPRTEKTGQCQSLESLIHHCLQNAVTKCDKGLEAATDMDFRFGHAEMQVVFTIQIAGS